MFQHDLGRSTFIIFVSISVKFNHSGNLVELAGHLERSCKVHSDSVPPVRRNVQRLKEALGTQSGDLVLLAGSTGPYVGLDILSHLWPVISSAD